MNASARKILLLGPQRPHINLGDAVAGAGFPDGPIAVISAGWQEAEADIEDIHELVKRPLVDLRLYARAEEIFATDTRLHELYRRRQDQLIELQQLYSLRLRQLMIATRQMVRARGDRAMIATEQRHAVAQLRALDRHHLKRVREILAEADLEIGEHNSAALQNHVESIQDVLAQCETVLITGGNVLVLLNRLRMFGVDQLLNSRHLVAWSAGAMVLSDRIVLFHDKTPLGRRDPELLSDGAGVLPGFVFLPDTARRLRKSDTTRTSLMSLRFRPRTCVTLDSGALIQFEDRILQKAENVFRIKKNGNLAPVKAP